MKIGPGDHSRAHILEARTAKQYVRLHTQMFVSIVLNWV